MPPPPAAPPRGKNWVLGHRVNAGWGSSVAPKIASGVTHKTTVSPQGKCEPGQKLPPTRATPHPCPNPARVNAPVVQNGFHMAPVPMRKSIAEVDVAVAKIMASIVKWGFPCMAVGDEASDLYPSFLSWGGGLRAF